MCSKRPESLTRRAVIATINVGLLAGMNALVGCRGDGPTPPITVALSTTLGTLGSVTDNNNRTYTATLTAGTTAGTATIAGTLNGMAITDGAAATFSMPVTWTWVSGSSSVDQPGLYGTQGVASGWNIPGARRVGTARRGSTPAATSGSSVVSAPTPQEASATSTICGASTGPTGPGSRGVTPAIDPASMVPRASRVARTSQGHVGGGRRGSTPAATSGSSVVWAPTPEEATAASTICGASTGPTAPGSRGVTPTINPASMVPRASQVARTSQGHVSVARRGSTPAATSGSSVVSAATPEEATAASTICGASTGPAGPGSRGATPTINPASMVPRASRVARTSQGDVTVARRGSTPAATSGSSVVSAATPEEATAASTICGASTGPAGPGSRGATPTINPASMVPRASRVARTSQGDVTVARRGSTPAATSGSSVVSAPTPQEASATSTICGASTGPTGPWVSGSNTNNQPGVYGTQGVASGSNIPGARWGGASWIDASGNLWLFGGVGSDAGGSNSRLNDLWRFDGTNWTWVSGSNTNNQPGVYGTQGVASGSNIPGARFGGASWIDASGNLWLFGGVGSDAGGSNGRLNDLWRFDGANWTWVSGSNTNNQPGVYGTPGSLPTSSVPRWSSARTAAAASWVAMRSTSSGGMPAWTKYSSSQ